MKSVMPLLLLVACGDVVVGAPDAGVDAEVLDAPVVEIDSPTCDDTPAVLPQPFAFSTAGAFSGTSLVAVIDGSGIVGDTHDCLNANTWLANGVDNATITLDLQETYDLTQVRVWNHGGLSGGRGVRNLTASVSLNNVSYSQLPGIPLGLARATVCPVTAETFDVPDVRARFVRIEIASSHGSTPVGLSEIQLVGSRVCE